MGSRDDIAWDAANWPYGYGRAKLPSLSDSPLATVIQGSVVDFLAWTTTTPLRPPQRLLRETTLPRSFLLGLDDPPPEGLFSKPGALMSTTMSSLWRIGSVALSSAAQSSTPSKPLTFTATSPRTRL